LHNAGHFYLTKLLMPVLLAAVADSGEKAASLTHHPVPAISPKSISILSKMALPEESNLQ
jgi:hypothetical protein